MAVMVARDVDGKASCRPSTHRTRVLSARERSTEVGERAVDGRLPATGAKQRASQLPREAPEKLRRRGALFLTEHKEEWMARAAQGEACRSLTLPALPEDSTTAPVGPSGTLAKAMVARGPSRSPIADAGLGIVPASDICQIDQPAPWSAASSQAAAHGLTSGWSSRVAPRPATARAREQVEEMLRMGNTEGELWPLVVSELVT